MRFPFRSPRRRGAYLGLAEASVVTKLLGGKGSKGEGRTYGKSTAHTKQYMASSIIDPQT